MFPMKLIQVQVLEILRGLKPQLQRRANLLSELNFNTTCFRTHNKIKVLYFTQIDTTMENELSIYTIKPKHLTFY